MSRYLVSPRIAHRLNFEVSGNDPDELDRSAKDVIDSFIGGRKLVYRYSIESTGLVRDFSSVAERLWLGRVEAELWEPPR